MEKVYDSEDVMNLISHIDNPCTVEVNGKIEHIRPFYLKLASDLLPELTNPFARRALELKIREYS